MLKTRILTALVLLPVALSGIFLLTPQNFALAVALLLLVGCWEFHRLARLQSAGGVMLVLLQAALLALLWHFADHWRPDPIRTMEVLCVLWLLLFSQLRWQDPARPPGPGYPLQVCANALVSISGAWLALSWLRAEPAGQWWILALLLIIWAADIGAYFAGRRFGKRKLAVRISPGKTWAGFFGGLASAMLVAVLAGRYLPGLAAPALPMAMLGAATAVVSVAGALFISLHKRTVGMKDTGRLFPGHGGVLDRFDSLLSGAPFFALGKLLLGL